MDLSERPTGATRRSPWETARFRHFWGVLRRSGAVDRAVDVLDIGAGDAWFGGQLHSCLPTASTVTCWDHAYSDADLGQLPEGVRGSREQPEGLFGLVMLLDVLEHVHDDRALLQSGLDRLGPDGWLLMSVPAWPGLFSSHDEMLGHHRRYRPAEGLALLRGAGLEPGWSGGLFASLMPVRALQLMGERLRPPSRSEPKPLQWQAGPVAARVVDGVLRADAALGRGAARRGLPLPGLSWWALCRRS